MKFGTVLKSLVAAGAAPFASAGPPPWRCTFFCGDYADFAAYCYAQSSSVGDPGTDVAGAARRLVQDSDGFVVHDSLPREDVTAALASALRGGSNFELMQVTDSGGTKLFDLSRDGMEASVADANDLDQPFTVRNDFVVDQPGVFYTVSCPAASDPKSEHCPYTVEDKEGNSLLGCEQEGSLLPAGAVPAPCLDELYDVTGKASKRGAHFFLAASRRNGAAGGHDGCPRNVAFHSWEGTRKRVVMFEPDLEQLPGYQLGAATLGDLFRAEAAAEPLSATNYDLVTKNCAIYARDILRGVGLPESKELAKWFIQRLEENPEMVEQLRVALGRGRFRALSMLGFGSNKGLFDKVVYAQLEIKDL